MAKGKKTGGRAKGTPNKTRINAQAIADEVGIDPLRVLMLAAKGDSDALGEKITLDQRISAAKEAAKYLYPQRKAIEHTIEEDSGPKIASMLEIVRGIVEEDT